MNDNYKRMCKLVTAEHNKLSENGALQLFTSHVAVKQQQLSSRNFF